MDPLIKVSFYMPSHERNDAPIFLICVIKLQENKCLCYLFWAIELHRIECPFFFVSSSYVIGLQEYRKLQGPFFSFSFFFLLMQSGSRH